MKALLTCVVLSLCACSAEVVRQPAELRKVPGGPSVIEVSKQVKFTLATGYDRTVAAGSRWRAMGQLPAGIAYKPVNGVLTVEGAHVHEAWLVLDGGRLVGFYLPADNAFSPHNPVQVETIKREE